MRAVQVRSFEAGGAGLAELGDPALPAGHVMIEVAAAGVGFATLMVFDGSHQNTPAPPFVPGTEVAGRIARLGDGVDGLALGQRVVAWVQAGGFAERVAARADRVYGIPDAMSYFDATQFATIYSTGGRGADVVYDPVGGQVFDESLRCMAPEGRILPMGFAGGQVPQIPANILLVKNLTVIGLYWGYYVDWAKQPAAPGLMAEVQRMMAEMFAWHSEGKLRPVTYRALDLADFAEALDIIRRREVIGRVALTTGLADG